MQSKNYDIALVVKLLEKSIHSFSNLTTDNHNNDILVVAGELASEIDANRNFETTSRHQVH